MIIADKEKVSEFYTMLLSEHGDTPEGSGWSAENQEQRFALLMSAGDFTGARVLDYGCGKGDLWGWIKAKEIKCLYTGWDICEVAIQKAQEKYSNALFEVRDIEELKDFQARFDFVVMSGVFNLKTKNNWLTLRTVTSKAWELSKYGLAFNVLCDHASPKVESQWYVDPFQTQRWVMNNITRRIAARFHGNEMSLLLVKG